MMKKNPFKFLLFALFLAPLFSAAQDTTWFDRDWKECPRMYASYYHLESTEGDLMTFRDFYKANDQLQNTGFYKAGKKHGNWIWWDVDGNETSIQYFEAGKKEGLHEWFYANGKIKTRRKYENDQQVGQTQYFNEDGEPIEMIEDSDWDAEEGSDIPHPNAFVMVDVEPRALNLNDIKVAIGYPKLAVEAGIEGKVIVRVLVDEKGNYMRHLLVRKAHPILNQAVEQEMSGLRFRPAMLKGKPVKVWVTIPFDFKLLPPDPEPEGNDGEGEDIFDFGPLEELETPASEDASEPDPDKRYYYDVEAEALNYLDVKNDITYPPMAVEAELEGMVVVRILFDASGNYVKHIVERDPHPLLSRAVAERLPEIKVKPAEKAGKKVACWITMPFRFDLDGVEQPKKSGHDK